MNRRTPLARRTPIRAKAPLKSTGRIRPKARRLPQPSRVEWGDKRMALYARANGRCEHCGTSLDDTGMEAHHRLLRSQGGHHGLDNLTALCPRCHHDQIHAHPGYARSKGFIVSAGHDPAMRAVELHDGRIVRLNADGTYDLCFTTEGDAA